MKTFTLALAALVLVAPARAQVRAGATTENGLGMKLAWIPAGEFLMGSPFDDASRMPDELPRRVVITRPFRMGVTEVTQAEWRAVMDASPSRFPGDDRPVEMVSWKDAVEFCRRLSEREGKVYRLPTEAEWEYACRAGRERPPAPGRLPALAWFAENSGKETHPVAGKRPNRWGLYDMLGNVAEWCADGYGPYADEATVTDPTGATEEGAPRVVRGGSWLHFAPACRPAARLSVPEAYQYAHLGFRVVEEIAP